MQGKELSYNNLNDTDAAFELIAEFDPKAGPACAIIKHANPCGVALGETIEEAVVREAQRWVQHIVAADSAPEGSVETIDQDTFWGTKENPGAHATLGPDDAVLCRNTKPLISLAYGLLLNLWFWPTLTVSGTLPESISFIPGAGFATNIAHWLRFSVATSLGFDIPRAALTVILILVAGRPILNALRRASRRAAFDVPVEFTPARSAI